jgi:hypothetical protein
MPDRLHAHDFVYVQTDIPEGMTIRDWRARRGAERAAQRERERAARRRRVRASLTALGLAFARARAIARSSAAIISRPAHRSRRAARYPWPRIRSFRRAAG